MIFFNIYVRLVVFCLLSISAWSLEVDVFSPSMKITPQYLADGYGILGETNLPDHTVVFVDIKGEVADRGWWARVFNRKKLYLASPITFISGGRFLVEIKGALPVGNYTVTVSTHCTDGQPNEVRKVIGEKGEKMRGNGVERCGMSYYFSRSFNIARSK